MKYVQEKVESKSESIKAGETLLLTQVKLPKVNGAYNHALLPSPTFAEAIGFSGNGHILVKQTVDGLNSYTICAPDTNIPGPPELKVDFGSDCKFMFFTNLQSRPYLYDPKELIKIDSDQNIMIQNPDLLFHAKTKGHELFKIKNTEPNPYRHPLSDSLTKLCIENPREKPALYISISQNEAGEDIICGYGSYGTYQEYGSQRTSTISFLMLTKPRYLDPQFISNDDFYKRIQEILLTIPQYQTDYHDNSRKSFAHWSIDKKIEIIVSRAPSYGIQRVKPVEAKSDTPFCCARLSDALLAHLSNPELDIEYKHEGVNIKFSNIRHQIFADISSCMSKLNLELGPLLTEIHTTKIRTNLFRATHDEVAINHIKIPPQITQINFQPDINQDELALLTLIKGTQATDNDDHHLFVIDEGVQLNGSRLQMQESIQLQLKGNYSKILIPSFPFRSITMDGDTILPPHTSPLWQSGNIDRLYIQNTTVTNIVLTNMTNILETADKEKNITLYFDNLETAKYYASLVPVYPTEGDGTYSNIKIYYNSAGQKFEKVYLKKLERLAIRSRLGIYPWSTFPDHAQNMAP